MRSELVAAAAPSVRNRYLLVHVASLLTRKFHRPGKERVGETINRSLAGLGEGKYLVSSCSFTGKGEFRYLKEEFLVHPGVLDLDTFNGFTGEAQCSYVRPDADEPTPEERMAVCSALLGADAVVETA